ncbi:hypothetical protein [Solimicrobium silvestre]|uniref:Uncharacterized protein n=1 Tax=Solimicrobium silvestre TaxID=2099400 RepID=A0A2S9H2I3_9BURK|nr:hypothetical protein [Solimicrobium silvestre]PRC94192.1 hypothetical protein S2091_0813 [Solimicrobium silvestre]
MRASTSKFAHFKLVFGLFLLGLMLSATSYAIDRPLPVNAKLGTFSPSANPAIVIDGNVRQLTAGAQIRNHHNVIVQPMSLSGPDVQILYKENSQGQIERIWILTKDEVQAYSAGPQPATPLPSPTPTSAN